MNRRIEVKLRQLERQLISINTPSKTPNRTLLQNSKTRQLKALTEMVYETQKLINELDDFTEAELYQEELDNCEMCRREALRPAITMICEA